MSYSLSTEMSCSTYHLMETGLCSSKSNTVENSHFGFSDAFDAAEDTLLFETLFMASETLRSPNFLFLAMPSYLSLKAAFLPSLKLAFFSCALFPPLVSVCPFFLQSSFIAIHVPWAPYFVYQSPTSCLNSRLTSAVICLKSPLEWKYILVKGVREGIIAFLQWKASRSHLVILLDYRKMKADMSCVRPHTQQQPTA